jgi:hypothetical protein
MKQVKFIFPCIFLVGMLLTVFQYLPILEESPGHLVELQKKAKEDDSSGNDTPGDDSDTGDNDLALPINFYWHNPPVSSPLHNIHDISYTYLIKNVSTPPPKI